MAFLDSGVKDAEFAANTSLCVTLNQIKVGLFRTSDRIFAVNNVCPHRGAPLHEGFVTDAKVTCPWHQWDFNLADGACLTVPQVRIPSYPVDVREGTIWIDLEHDTK